MRVSGVTAPVARNAALEDQRVTATAEHPPRSDHPPPVPAGRNRRRTSLPAPPSADRRAMTAKRYLIFDAYYDATGDNLRHIRTLFRNARPEGWQPMLVCPGDGALTAAVQDAGGDVAVVPQQPQLDRYGGTVLSSGVSGLLSALIALAAYNFQMLAALREMRPDAIQCHNVRSLLMIGLAARLLRIPTILYVKFEQPNPVLQRIAFRLARRVLFAATTLMPRRRSSKFGLLPVGVDFADVDRVLAGRPGGMDPEDNKEHLTFAWAGWLLPVNGVHVLVDAFERTTHHVSDMRLEIFGDSDDEDYKQELRNVVEWQNLGNRVAFHGWRNDLIDALDAADVYVQPSCAGGVSLALIEAMALGKAVVATDAGGTRELLDDGELGLLTDANDSTALASALYRIVAERELRRTYGQKAAEAARTRYSIDTHLSGLEAELDALTAGRTPNSSAAGVGVAA